MEEASKRSRIGLLTEIEALKHRLHEAEDTLDAIRTGAVDALAINAPDGARIYTLENADRTYRALIEEMNEGAILLNREGLILYSNSEFAHLINLPLSQVMSTSFFSFLPVEVLETFTDLFIKGWTTPCRGEFVLIPHSHDALFVQLSFKAIELNEGIALGMVVTDLTELKRAYHKLEKTQQELQTLNVHLEQRVIERTNDLSIAKKEVEESNSALIQKNHELIKTNNDLDNFIYTASHDLKAPISNLEGLISALKNEMQRNTAPKSDRIVAMMATSVDRLKETIYDLTEITKVQKEKPEDVAQVNCIEIVEEVIFTLQELIASSNANIITTLDACHTIKFSKKNLKSIFLNLVSNAIKFRSLDRTPKIEIRAERKDHLMTLSVSDNGLGISVHNKEKIFNMFKRLHTHVEGTGVGLYIVKRIVDNAGGSIEVDSEIGKGSTFTLNIPQ